MLVKASSGERNVPRHFMLLVRLVGARVCRLVPRHVPTEGDYGKMNVETNAGTAVSTRTTSFTRRH